jgi:predicted nucleic acid-binding protein
MTDKVFLDTNILVYAALQSDASALEVGCGILFSENLQDGQLIDGRLTVLNPFGKGIEATL